MRVLEASEKGPSENETLEAGEKSSPKDGR
jgi:hypothetical protein